MGAFSPIMNVKAVSLCVCEYSRFGKAQCTRDISL